MNAFVFIAAASRFKTYRNSNLLALNGIATFLGVCSGAIGT